MEIEVFLPKITEHKNILQKIMLSISNNAVSNTSRIEYFVISKHL